MKAEMGAANTLAEKGKVFIDWGLTSATQDGAFAAGIVASVPEGLYDNAVELKEPQQAISALRELANSDDIIGTVAQSVKQEWLARINRMEAHYQQAGASGAYESGVEAGKLPFEFGGYAVGVGGLAKGGVRLASGKAKWFETKRTTGGKSIAFDGEFYSVDGLKFSKNYYDRLWNQGRPAPFLQAKEVLNSNPKIIPDPKGAPGYFKYEGAGLEMIYNPTTGQVGHIQPIKIK